MLEVSWKGGQAHYNGLGRGEPWFPGFDLLSLCVFSKQLEEEEQEDKFDLTVGVSDPEKVGELLSCRVKGLGEPGLAR